MPVHVYFTQKTPLVVGDPNGAAPILVVAQHYGRAAYRDELWITGSGVDDALERGLYSEIVTEGAPADDTSGDAAEAQAADDDPKVPAINLTDEGEDE